MFDLRATPATPARRNRYIELLTFLIKFTPIDRQSREPGVRGAGSNFVFDAEGGLLRRLRNSAKESTSLDRPRGIIATVPSREQSKTRGNFKRECETWDSRDWKRKDKTELTRIRKFDFRRGNVCKKFPSVNSHWQLISVFIVWSVIDWNVNQLGLIYSQNKREASNIAKFWII